LGVNYTVLRKWSTNFALGAQGSVYRTDDELYPVYGKNPLAAEVYLRISPAIMNTMNSK
jgi:hypothetical protein